MSNNHDTISNTIPTVVIAKLLKPIGLHGWVRIVLNTDCLFRFKPNSKLTLRRAGLPLEILTVAHMRKTSFPDRLDLLFDGIEDRNAAARLLPGEFVIDLAERVPPPPGCFYPDELEGMTVMSPDGTAEGVVEKLMVDVPSPYLSVKSPKLGEVLIPYRKACFIEISRETRTVKLRAPLAEHVPID